MLASVGHPYSMRVLSGIQPSGAAHLGNYFGMMRPAIELQARHEGCFYFIADYHALTSAGESGGLEQRVQDLAVDFLACGLDPSRTVFYRQSAVPEVHELAWYLSQVTPVGLLERCHSYKDKTSRGLAANHGLFAYPVLMAADILLYDADLVPVGKDQKQHLEVTRDIAQKFNEAFGPVFKLPEPSIREETATLPGLDGQKMSKSYHNTLDLFAPEKEFRKKIMSLKTDSTPVEAPKPIEGSLLLALAKPAASDEQFAALVSSMQAGGRGYGDYKKELFELLWEFLRPMREKRAELAADPGWVAGVLQQGGEKARVVAATTLERVRKAVGIQP
ncbi:MAG: tryptophan--tRNA ligase [Candidatus Methylacidiphilales bacterium]|nr:tryptophan--tRNA ligase [Candidatus Methylacidiphilales bacterium]